MSDSFQKLMQQLELPFQDVALLKQAFTHASYRNENKLGGLADNERLEFLGDAVLELVVSEYLYLAYPDMPEGDLTRLRASIVCEPSLVGFAKRLQFDHCILLGKGEELSGGRQRPALLADVFEAFVGALFLDQGIAVVKQFMQVYVFPHLAEIDSSVLSDYKTLLQEYVQKHSMGDLQYRIVSEKGPAHHREFVAKVFIDHKAYGIGMGRSKKEAEQHAAEDTLKQLQVHME
ncbi:ribonuclease III [Fodinisporobacter ferrooxydans]|uniref:ribonuclease III n=1 Tax=Fodinisporobacter ferrooxydans TaxID=2901836 RepID=UPI003242A03D